MQIESVINIPTLSAELFIILSIESLVRKQYVGVQ